MKLAFVFFIANIIPVHLGASALIPVKALAVVTHHYFCYYRK
jgi:hypothetical protein